MEGARNRIPPIIEQVGFDFRWDVRLVWALQLPTRSMRTSDLTWHLQIPFWGTGDRGYTIAPQDVLDHPDRYPDEVRRIHASDLRYPVDVMHWRGRWLFLDGLHRFVKALQSSASHVDVRCVPPSAIPLIAPRRS